MGRGVNPETRSPADLLTRLGGAEKLESIVGAFVFNLLNDERASGWIVDADITSMLRDQKRFLASALGEEASGDQDALAGKAVPSKRSDTSAARDPAFDVVAELMAATLADLGYTEDLIAAVIGRLDWETWRRLFG